ncbi:MAG: hypothetical protein RLZZ301_336 [Bacteroidota bacterium]|jgi:cbb3-type cytochrome oxidase subunit 3
MLRFIKHNLTSIFNVEIYPLITLVLFSLFFLIVLLYVWKLSKERITEMSAFPLDFDQQNEELTKSEQQ